MDGFRREDAVEAQSVGSAVKGDARLVVPDLRLKLVHHRRWDVRRVRHDDVVSLQRPIFRAFGQCREHVTPQKGEVDRLRYQQSLGILSRDGERGVGDIHRRGVAESAEFREGDGDTAGAGADIEERCAFVIHM